MEIAAVSAALVTQTQALPVVPSAQPLATERFNAVMNVPDVQPLAGTQAVLQVSFAPAPLETSPTLGGQILSGLRSMSADFSSKWQNLATGIDNMSIQPTVVDMVRTQRQLLDVSVHYDLISKVTSRTSQNIDSIVRMS